LDLYDKGPLIDFNYDLHNLPFPDASFDFVVAEAILEHVEDPLKAISELHRVLRPGGEIWVDLPMSQQYHPTPNDYWRVTHKGILIWMKNFKEIASGLVPIDGCPFYDYVYFHGAKP
jgi:ubiquinone/menaquinone biosynthesis C-methylase UbiE